MRFLCVSDIHGNASAVRKLCALEGPNFSAVIIAGDIGEGIESSQEVFTALQHFQCPILYVLGNWDYEIPYDMDFGTNCHHLHLKPFECGPVTFVGFSGCDANWGFNTLLADALAEVRFKHRKVLERHALLQTEAEPAFARISAGHESELLAVTAETRNTETKAFMKVVERLERKRDEAIGRARYKIDRLETSKAWFEFREDENAAHLRAQKANRKALAKVIADSALDPVRTVVVTHERLFRTAEDLPGVGLCVFGHSGTFADTKFKGTRFINTNALDIPIAAIPENVSPDDYGWDDVKHINGGHYVKLEWKECGNHHVECVRFKPTFPGWLPIPDADGMKVVGNPYLE